MIKIFLCHLSPFSDIKSLQGLLKVMAECDDKDISVQPFLLNSRPIFFHETKVENKIYL